jgi:hypothetical protein
MENEKKIKEFLDSNIDLFLSDILELPPKERAKAFLSLMNRGTTPAVFGVNGIKPIEWVSTEEINKEIQDYERRNPKTEEELTKELARLRAIRIEKENNERESEDYMFSKGRLNEMNYRLR